MLDYSLTAEGLNRFSGFAHEKEGNFEEQVKGEIKFHTEVEQE